jgi:hypothetical protein
MSSSSGRPVYHDPRTGRSFYYEPRTSEFVYSDGSRVPASSQFAQPAPNVPRTSPGVVQQQSSNTFSNHPYNQQYTSLPPVTAGPSVQGVTQQFQNVNIAKSFAPNTSTIPYAAGRPIDGAEVVRNPPIRGAPPRRVSFLPEHRNGLLDPGMSKIAASLRYLANNSRLQGARASKGILRSRQGTCLSIAGRKNFVDTE